MRKSSVWLIGAGNMALEYLKVLKDLNQDVIVIGRGEERCEVIKKTFDCKVVSGGLESFLKNKPELPEKAIVAAGVTQLKKLTVALLNFGVRDVLVEKPGVGNVSEIHELCSLTKQKNANVLLAYNRRFYASVLKAKEIIEEDGGISSFNFEFTEWSHIIKDFDKDPTEHQHWFLANSTHIVDTAFYLGGFPKEMASFVSGENEMEWHKASSNFSGAGISNQNALFAYHANWQGPGRWSMEFITKKHRLIFRPIEKLQIQQVGSVVINFLENIDYRLDEKYKPGLYLQTKAFLEGNTEDFCDVHQQKQMIENYYQKMSNY